MVNLLQVINRVFVTCYVELRAPFGEDISRHEAPVAVLS